MNKNYKDREEIEIDISNKNNVLDSFENDIILWEAIIEYNYFKNIKIEEEKKDIQKNLNNKMS